MEPQPVLVRIERPEPFAALLHEPGGQGAKDGVFTLPIAEYQKRFQYTTWTQPEAASPR